MSTHRRALAAALGMLLAVASRTTPALGQETNVADRPEKLFNEAAALIESGDFARACPKLEESHRLDPAIGTQYNLALCYEKIGKLGSAFRNLRAVERLSHATGKKNREEAARNKLDELRPKVSHLVLVADDADATLKIDGVRIEREDFAFYAVDTGGHEIEATAPAKKPWHGHVDIPEARAGSETRVRVPRLDVDTKIVTTEKSNTKRTLSFVAGGIGAVGLGVAGVTGVLILQDKSTADEKCAPRCIDQEGRDAVTRGETLLPINVIAAAVGVVGLGIGTFLFFASKSTPTNPVGVVVRPYAGLGAAGLGGTF